MSIQPEAKSCSELTSSVCCEGPWLSGNYLAHTQGKRHQQNLAKRAAREAGAATVHSSTSELHLS